MHESISATDCAQPCARCSSTIVRFSESGTHDDVDVIAQCVGCHNVLKWHATAFSVDIHELKASLAKYSMQKPKPIPYVSAFDVPL